MIKIGDKFGGLIILRKAIKEEKELCHPNVSDAYWLCECSECHNFVFCSSSYLKRGNRSCGCNANCIKENNYSCVEYKDIYK